MGGFRDADGSRLYELLAENSSDVIFVTRNDGEGRAVFDYVSPAARSVYGWDAKKLVGRTVDELLHPDDFARLMACRTAALADGAGRVLLYRFRAEDGAYRWLESNCRPFDDGSGRPAIQGSARDVTARVENDQRHRLIAENALRDVTELVEAERRRAEDEARFRLLTENALDGIFLTGMDGRFVYLSPATRGVLGWEIDELVGVDPLDLVHPEDRAFVESARSSLRTEADAMTTVARMRRSNGIYRWIEIRGKPLHDPVSGQRTGVQGGVRDVSDRRLAEIELEHRTLTDPLTGIGNRPLLMGSLHTAVDALDARSGAVAVLMLDLDRFKVINDSLGHQAGDELLVQTAHRLAAAVGPGCVVARMGGDEFVVIVSEFGVMEELEILADRILVSLRRPYVVEGGEVVTTASIGIAATALRMANPEDLLRQADIALYKAKDAGRDRAVLFDEELQAAAVARLGTERIVRRAIQQATVTAVFQPFIDLWTGTLCGAEALMRIEDPDVGVLGPSGFLPVAEETGLLSQLDDQVRELALERLPEWCAGGRPFRLSINATPREVSDPRFVRSLLQRLDRSGIPGEHLMVEVTENALLEYSAEVTTAFARLRSHGVLVGLDDFGSGFSALSYLRNLPLDFLKIDRAFMATPHARARQLIGAIVDLAHGLGLMTIGEGIEQQAQLDLLTHVGCDWAQGFLLGRPMTAPELTVRLTRETRPLARKSQVPLSGL